MTTKLQIFDPPMCCSTGVCGPSPDPVLPRFAADLQTLANQGISVERYNLAQQPQAFAANGRLRLRSVQPCFENWSRRRLAANAECSEP